MKQCRVCGGDGKIDYAPRGAARPDIKLCRTCSGTGGYQYQECRNAHRGKSKWATGWVIGACIAITIYSILKLARIL